MKVEQPTPNCSKFTALLPGRPGPESSKHQQKTVLLALTALVIIWSGIYTKGEIRSEEALTPTIGEIISSIGKSTDCAEEPRRAVFSFSPVDLNAADAEVLASLRGIGPAIAKRIVLYRQIHGVFNDPDELLNVRGIGRRKLSGIREDLTIGRCAK